jgi:class 3 adenylate cyclase
VLSVSAGAASVARQRKLTAILCADIAGFSRLMGEDETATYDALARLRSVVDPLIAKHGGRIVSTAGDGLLADFASVVDALSCAVEMQDAVGRLNEPLAPDRRLELRIGVNLGDVIVAEDGDLYGDGVNIAARLQTLASPGGICLSQTVYDQVSNKLDLDYRPLGKHRVKNIATPVSAYAIGPDRSAGWFWRIARRRAMVAMIGALIIVNVGLFVWLLAPPAGRQLPVATVEAAPVATLAVPARMAERTSVAVLPFKNLSPDAGQDFFSDGVSEDIINAIGRFSNLLVAAKSASFQFKGRNVSPEEAGRVLGARYLVEGSVRRGRRPAAHHRRVDRGGDRISSVVGGIQRRAERCFYGPGRHHPPHRRGRRGQADTAGARARPAQTDSKSHRLRIRFARPRRCDGEQSDPGGQ